MGGYLAVSSEILRDGLLLRVVGCIFNFVKLV